MNRTSFSALLILFTSTVYTTEAGNLSEALTSGEANLTFRYRFENVDEDGKTRSAAASTIRTRLNYQSATYHQASFFVEVDDVTYLGEENFNNTRNGRTVYPTVADPDGTDINQLYITLQTDLFRSKLGRQRINLDNQRFVGGVGWRQNEQTFDALSLFFDRDNVDVNYAYVSRVSRIFGPGAGTPADTIDANMHLLNLSFSVSPGKFSAYAYAMDLEDAPAASNQTLGLRYAATFDNNGIKIPLALEFARQADYGDNPAPYSASYYLVDVGLQFEKSRIGAGYEVMQGSPDPGKVFITPLATGHAFNGWADKLLATPTGGIEDKYISFQHTLGKHRLAATWHQFDAEASSLSYGSELDASWAVQFNRHYSLLVKAAFYNADRLATDTEKIWVMFTASY